MAMEYDFTKIESKLNDLEKKVAKEITEKALKAGAEPVLEAQLKSVPKDTHKLEESLMIGKITGTGAKKKILIGIDPSKYEQVKYGFYQEYGTTRMNGKKWMKNAYGDSIKQASKIIIDNLVDELTKK